MKQRFTLFIATLILSVCFPLTALAYDVLVDGIYYNLVAQEKTAEVTSGDNKYTGEITIPETITVDEEVYNVTSIGDAAFKGCSSLTSITIPNSVTSIGYRTFFGCTSLSSVTIPNSVTSIGDMAFASCSSLTSISVDPNNTIYDSRDNCNAIIRTSDNALIVGCQSTIIPNSVTSIRYRTFFGCTSLSSVTIPNSVTSIGDDAFAWCPSLTSVTIPNSVTSIGGYAFYNCSSLTSVTIPNSVTSIGGYTFHSCSSLTSVTIGNSVTSIGDAAFKGCSSLTSVTIPNSVTSIGESVFYNCSSLTSVTIGNSVTSIGDWAFCGCSSLPSVTIGNSVTSIGERAFLDCSSLSSISVDSNNTIYDSRDNCNAIIRTSDNALIVGCQSTIIPNTVTSIGNYAFYGCRGLTSVTIPNSVRSIGNSAFSGCSSLTSVTIPNSVTSIGEYAFRYCSSLTSVTIPNSVTSIGKGAFDSCSSLTSVTIPNSVKSIGKLAFYYCSSLTSVTIPNSVTWIGGEAFAYCENLENVYCYAETVPSTDTDAFYDSNVESAILYVPASVIDAYKTTEPWSTFGTIKTLNEVEKEKCETPTIAFSDGRLTFSCATDDVEYISEVTSADFNKFYTAEVALTACYDISVTATKTGYKNSDVATAKLYWLTSSETSDDDTNINSISKRGIAIQTAAGFITISGLDDNEKVDFYTLNGTALGAARATNGVATFSAQSGSVLIVRIGNESVKIIVE